MNKKTVLIAGVGIVIGAGLFCFFCFGLAALGSLVEPTPKSADVSRINEPVENTQPPPLTFDEVRPSKGNFTDLQWDEYRRSLHGRKVERWAGVINEVRETALSNKYYVEVKIAREYDDVFLYTDKDTALNLPKNGNIVFSGEVVNTSPRLFRDGFALEIDNATIESVK